MGPDRTSCVSGRAAWPEVATTTFRLSHGFAETECNVTVSIVPMAFDSGAAECLCDDSAKIAPAKQGIKKESVV